MGCLLCTHIVHVVVVLPGSLYTVVVVCVQSVEGWCAEQTWSGHCPVSVHVHLESREVGVLASRDPSGFQHTFAVNLGWAHVVQSKESLAYVQIMAVYGDIQGKSVPCLGSHVSSLYLGGD